MIEKPGPDKPSQRGKAPKRIRKILGPVQNLEEHVHTEWWCRIFNSLYLKTDADVVDDQCITCSEVDMFAAALALKPEERVLDLACGQGRHSLELARRGFRGVEGLDRSHYLIQRARATAKKEGLTIKFKEGDARNLPFPADSFDAVMILGNSFGYFENAHEDLRVLKEVFRILKPWGRLLIDVADGEYLREHFQPRSWEWINQKYFVCRERSLSADEDRLISREVITHVEKGVIDDRFYAERLYTEESMTKLLRSAGLADVTFHAKFSPNSQRNQDLGMMESRHLATAVVKKEWSPVKRKAKETTKTVGVLMGDPTKPDTLKPGFIFDDDDIYTIDRLKAALRDLKGYTFLYLNSHDSMIAELSRLTGKIDYVFNLCDEGFNNQARLELHVPAILEILGIPYTGGGPQCLAHCYDKSLVRGIAKEMGIAVPKAFFIKPEESTFELPFDLPVIVKPNFGDSSFGITQRSVANTLEEYINAIADIREKFGYDKPILVEEFLPGKDLSLGIIGNPPDSYTALPIIEEDYSTVPEGLPQICGYEAKWLPESPYGKVSSIPAEIPEETRNLIVEWSVSLMERLECRDYSRFDWRLDAEGNPRLLEVNPNPGWCWDGHLAKMAAITAISYPEMIEAILTAAEARLKIAGTPAPEEKGEARTDQREVPASL